MQCKCYVNHCCTVCSGNHNKEKSLLMFSSDTLFLKWFLTTAVEWRVPAGRHRALTVPQSAYGRAPSPAPLCLVPPWIPTFLYFIHFIFPSLHSETPDGFLSLVYTFYPHQLLPAFPLGPCHHLPQWAQGCPSRAWSACPVRCPVLAGGLHEAPDHTSWPTASALWTMGRGLMGLLSPCLELETPRGLFSN